MPPSGQVEQDSEAFTQLGKNACADVASCGRDPGQGDRTDVLTLSGGKDLEAVDIVGLNGDLGTEGPDGPREWDHVYQ